MDTEIDKLRYVVVPANETKGGKDLRVEVSPVTNSWLTSKERKWDEIDAVLEGRLQAIQKSFTEISGIPDQMARSYGVEKPVGDNLARLLAYAELLGSLKSLT